MKRKQKRVSKRILASALTAALCMNYVPVLAVAEGESEVNSESKQVGVDDIVEVSPNNEKFSETETSDENHENESADVVPENSISYTESEYTVNISPVPEDVASVYEVDINGKRDSISVNNGDKLVLHARIKEGVEKLYRISDVRIGNTAVDAKNAENFDVDIEITPDMADENGNIQVTVDFTRVYTASFYYNPNDESITPSTEIKVTDDNGNAIGTATFNDDGNMRFAAVPNNNYRVSSVIVDSKYTNYDENDKSVLIENVSSDNEHYIDAVFALNNCSIQSEESVNGTVNATVDNVVYGGISEIMLTPDKGCYLKSVFINDKPFDVSNMHSGGKITIDGVTEDKHIKAEFRKYSDDYSWNYDNAIKSEGEKYIFGKDRTVLFHTEQSGIRLIDENNAVILGDENTDSLSINSDREKITVSAVDIYYNENGWQRVSLEKPIEISFYENIAASLTLPEYNEGCMCYGSDVRIKMNVTSESMYSLISSVEYWIDDSEEHHTLKNGQNEILIPAEGNNRADMVVHAAITDILGSKTEIETEPFSINSVVPTVEIFSDDSISDEADDAHYTNGRTFRVTVDDAAYTQKQDLSMFSITKDGKVLSDKEKSNIVTWIKDGSKLTALLNFSDDGKYSWNMLYINKAGKHNETVNTNGDDIYNFVLDNTFEEAYVKVGSKALNELLDVLTFGVMGNSDVIVTAEAKDELSGVKGIYFYKDVYSQERTSNKALTYDELENLYKENMFKPYNGEIVVPENEKAVVYVRFVDGAGNVVYRTSDGMIIDSLRSNVSINADEPNEFGIYNDDIDVNINVTDAFPYSGIQYVEYKVTSGRIVTQSGRFDDFEHDISDESNLQQEFNFDFTILSKLNNSSDVLLTVTVKDNAGNLTETVKSFDINKDNPSVTVSYDNNDAVNDMYFNSPRKATIVIKDRENYFDAAMATESISVIASDKDGNPVENAFTVSEWHSNADTHTADITFLGDAEYKFAVNYVSRSGSTAFAFADSSQKAPFEFVIDKTAPTGSIEIQNNTWSELLDKITFGMYSRQDFDVSASGSDNSGNVKMEYYISNSEKPLDKNYLNRLDESKWQKYTGTFKIPENENKNNRVWVVYLKVSDYAGNYVYICSDGHIIDNQPIDITATVAKNYSKDNTYSDDIEICVQAQDKAPYSGIKRINYWITSDGMITQEGELYNFDNAAPSYSEIENSVRKTFVIDSSLNNSSDVVIYVHAEDNAGNENTISRKFDVDVTKPEISIDYGGDEGKKGGFFSSPRQAKITVIERNSHFDPDTASDSIKITAKNAVGDIIDDAWSLSNWESDGDTHTAIITFSADARYSLSVSYTDKAGNTNAEINTGSSSYPYEFTVDTSAPAGIIKALSADSEYFEWNQFSDEESIPVTGVCKTEINVSADVSDELSGIDEIVYFKDVFDKDFEKLSSDARTFSELESIYNGNVEGKKFGDYPYGVTINADERAVVYARVTDGAGNVRYFNTDVLIVDKAVPVINSFRPKDGNKIYNGAVSYEIKVTDPNEKAFSGLDEIWCAVKKPDYAKTDDEENIVLIPVWKWNESDDNILTRSYGCDFTIDPADYDLNYDDLEVSLIVKDRAGNIYGDENSISKISININELSCEVDFEDKPENKRPDVEKSNYFTSRTAIVKIKNERNSSFDKDALVDAVKNSVRIITPDNPDETVFSDEAVSVDEVYYNSNEQEAWIKVSFIQEGNYIWESEKAVYTNKAGNSVKIINEDLSFSIDKTAPTGTINRNKQTWDSLLEVLTFGFYSQDSFTFSISGADNLNRFSIDYYISNRTTQMNADELDKITEWISYKEDFEISGDNDYVVYAKITDYAGNYTYISSDGHIIDRKAPEIHIKTPDEKNIYNYDVDVSVEVSDAHPYSGIQKVEYWITKDGKKMQYGRNTLYPTENTKNKVPYYSELDNELSFDGITINAEENNSSAVQFHVYAVDNAGNSTETVKDIDIDVTAPSVEVKYDNNKDNNGNGYFNRARTATVSITERSNHFNSDDALKGISITAVNSGGEPVEDAYTFSGWVTELSDSNPDEDVHTVMITFEKDANYTLDISYTDMAGNVNSSVKTADSTAPFRFTVDKTPPAGTVTAFSAEGREETWDKTVDRLSFGFWSNQRIDISSESHDETSPIEYVRYYNSTSSEALDRTSLDKIKEWKDFGGLIMYPNGQFATYLKIMDMAGNISYISTDGLTVDNVSPVGEVNAPEITLTPEQTESGIYNGDVNVAVTVDDSLTGDAYSGIRNISYRVLNMGIETQSGVLFEFIGDNPLKSELQKTWTGEISVSGNLNNSNDVVVEIYAEDNAGNSTTNTASLKIDVTPPEISVSYDNNSAVGNIFKSKRTAMITVKERNFSSEYVNLSLSRNGEEYSQALEWSSAGGSGDDALWYAELPFEADGEYTFGINCTDMASNMSNDVSFTEGTSNPESFTIDSSLPVIDVMFHDDSRFVNKNYYRGERTATVTINEKHFDKKAASDGIVISGSNDGEEISASIGEWKDDGDLHTVDIVFSEDGKYAMSISYTDIAGNSAQQYTTDFYIDKKDPSVSVKVNDRQGFGAYKDTVIPVVDYHDINLEENNVSVDMTGINVQVINPEISGDNIKFILQGKSGRKIEWKAKITESECHYGKTIVFDDFPEGEDFKEFDDIYTINISASDKSGRNSVYTGQFSVNRYGSTYDISAVMNMIGAYIQKENTVIVKEINPDELTDYSVTLFKNNEPEKLHEQQGDINKDYNMEFVGSDGEWHSYTYTINQGNFSDEGNYDVRLYSVDKAGNISQNTLKDKNGNINFAVDKKPPTAELINLKDNTTYVESSHKVLMTADDNIKLESIKVYLDDSDRIYCAWNSDEIERSSGDSGREFKNQYSFDIAGNTTDAHTLRIICKDASGRETQLFVKNFYVTTNPIIPFMKNYGWIIAAAAISITVGAVSLKFKKKKQNH